MKTDTFTLSRPDGTLLAIHVWSHAGEHPAPAPSGVLQIVHGMAEHASRYVRFASYLVERGWEVWAHDARGHGQTLALNRGNAETRGEAGNLGLHDGFARCVDDVFAVASAIRERRPDIPLYLLGHSWGSFQAQAAIERSVPPWDGCVLSGTRGPARFLMGFGRVLASLVMAIFGPRRHSRLVWALADGAYLKPFPAARTPFDWLSRDSDEVDAYIADPLCGFPCPVVFYRDLFAGLYRIHGNRALGTIRKDLPILIIAGGDDPVGDQGKSPRALAACYAKLGLSRVSLVLYPGGRHEMLNEINRDVVHGEVFSWLEASRVGD